MINLNKNEINQINTNITSEGINKKEKLLEAIEFTKEELIALSKPIEIKFRAKKIKNNKSIKLNRNIEFQVQRRLFNTSLNTYGSSELGSMFINF